MMEDSKNSVYNAVELQNVETKWFCAKIILKSVHIPDVSKKHLFENLYVIFKAIDSEDAKIKIQTLASSKEHSYKSANDDIIEWRFIGVEDIKEILSDEIIDNTEVYNDYYYRVDK